MGVTVEKVGSASMQSAFSVFLSHFSSASVITGCLIPPGFKFCPSPGLGPLNLERGVGRQVVLGELGTAFHS